MAFGALAHLMLKHAWDDDLLERLARWADLLRAVLRAPTALDLLRALLTHAVSVRGDFTAARVARVLLPLLDSVDRETVMSEFKTTADVLREEGRQREAANKLLRVLRRRFDFPDDLSAKIDSAPLTDLDRWFDRALDTDRLEDVFAD